MAVGALGVAAAMLRWRLWIVDQALPRAVVLGACSAAFTAAIVLVAVIATGGVRRAQVQGAALRRAGRDRPGAGLQPTAGAAGCATSSTASVPGGYAVLVGLANGLAAVDDETAARRIADAARRGLAVPWAALWAPTARPGMYRLAA